MNKTECLGICSQHFGSTLPSRADFPLMTEFLISSNISESKYKHFIYHAYVEYDLQSSGKGYHRKKQPKLNNFHL